MGTRLARHWRQPRQGPQDVKRLRFPRSQARLGF
jgi:hypothetical protein